jgi:hypothetical protein
MQDYFNLCLRLLRRCFLSRCCAVLISDFYNVHKSQSMQYIFSLISKWGIEPPMGPKAAVDGLLHSRHDLFNLLALPVVLFFLADYLFGRMGINRNDLNENETSFTLLWCVGELYFAVDLMWLLLWPRSVASPAIIVFHHIICCLGWCLPLLRVELAPYAAALLLVELNTFFLIAKRYFADISSVHVVMKHLFHVTWIGLRLVMYPAVCYMFSFEVHKSYIQSGYINLSSASMFILLLLICLNMKWTYDLYLKSDESMQKKGL